MIELEKRSDAPDVVPDQARSDEAPVRVCVIDLETNSFHAEIVDARANGTFEVLGKIKEMVQLGAQGLARHRLAAEAMDRKKTLTLRLETTSDPQRDIWGARHHADLFEDVYGLAVRVEAAG